MAKKRKIDPSTSSEPPKKQQQQQQQQVLKDDKEEYEYEEVEEEDEDEEVEEEEEEEQQDPDNDEPIQNLLEPFGKKHLASLLAKAAEKHSDVADRIRKIADGDPVYLKIFVHRLGWDTTADTHRAAFVDFGEIED